MEHQYGTYSLCGEPLSPEGFCSNGSCDNAYKGPSMHDRTEQILAGADPKKIIEAGDWDRIAIEYGRQGVASVPLHVVIAAAEDRSPGYSSKRDLIVQKKDVRDLQKEILQAQLHPGETYRSGRFTIRSLSYKSGMIEINYVDYKIDDVDFGLEQLAKAEAEPADD